jgi:hypothetical protein
MKLRSIEFWALGVVGGGKQPPINQQLKTQMFVY